MKVKEIHISELIPYEFNSRNHSEEQVNRIANSIKEFGFNQPIVIDKTKTIIAGHGRYLAAQKLGLKEIPIVQKDDLTELQIKAYRILDNKLQNDSTWAFNNLELDLGFLEDAGLDMAEWGLDDLRGLFPEPELEVKEDDFVACENQDIFIKRGDLIELGQHRVLCGDSTIREDADLLMGADRASLFITDPPYGVDYAAKNVFLNAISRGNHIQEDIQGDSQTTEEMKTFWQNAFDVAFDCTSDTASYYIFGPQGGDLMMMMSIKDANWQLKHMLVWAKNNHVLGRSDYNYKHEPIWFGWKNGCSHLFYGDASETSLWEFDKPLRNDLHPTMKPISLIGKAIRNSSKAGEVVLDLFLGSGSSLIAADQLNRICYGMEIEPKYCQVIIERYLKHCQTNNRQFDCRVNGEMLPEEFLTKLTDGKEKPRQAEVHT